MFDYNGRRYYLNDGGSLTVYEGATRVKPEDVSAYERNAAHYALVCGEKAMCYVWGRQDAGESTKDTRISQDFGEAYAAMVFRFRMDVSYSLPPVKDAFESWRSSRVTA